MAAARSRASSAPSSSIGSITFSMAVSDGTRWKDWNTKPTRAARRAARPSSSSAESSRPSSHTRPEVGVSRPASSASSVDLPAPDGPTIATESARPMAKLTSSRMVRLPSGLVTFLLRCSATSAAFESTDMKKLFLALLLVFGVPALADVSLADTARSDIADGPPPTVLVLGDSLSAGYGLAVEEIWVSLLASRLAQEGYGHRVVNASVSGDTTSGGLARLGGALTRHEPELVIIELGGNDGLRGLPLDVVRSNFEAMIEQSRQAGAEVVLLGMRIPVNYGPRYAESFHALYGELAETYDLEWVEFFLDGVALDDGLMQADGIHPNAEAQPLMLDNAWPAVAAALAE